MKAKRAGHNSFSKKEFDKTFFSRLNDKRLSKQDLIDFKEMLDKNFKETNADI